MDDFSSDEEQLRKLRQLALSLEKSIFPTAQQAPLPSAQLSRFSVPRDRSKPERSGSRGPSRSRSQSPFQVAKGASSRSPSARKEQRTRPPPELVDEDIHERLYRLRPKVRSPSQKAAKPVKGGKPQARRSAPLWDMNLNEKGRDLYIDAECRRRVLQERVLEKEKQAESDSRRVNTGPKSDLLAKRHMLRALRELFSRYSTATDNPALEPQIQSLGKVSYVALKAALVDLGFLSAKRTEEDDKLADKAWAAMHAVQAQRNPGAPGVYVHFPGFASVVLKMLDGKTDMARSGRAAFRLDADGPLKRSGSRSMSLGKSKDAAQQKRVRSASPSTSHVSRRSSSLNLIADPGCAPLQTHLRQDIISRQLAEPNKAKKPETGPECTFNPAINDASRKLSRSQNSVPSHLRLSAPLATKAQKLEEARKYKAESELQACTFQPSINKFSAALRREGAEPAYTAPIVRQKEERLTHVTIEEQELEECTFEPKVNQYKKLKDQPLPNGYYESIKRLREGKWDTRTFEDRLRERDEISTRLTYSQRYGQRPTVPKPFNLRSDGKAARQKPLVVLDVQLPKGRKGKIGIYEHDTADALVKNFAAAYRLDRASEAKLLKVLEHHINTLVPELAAKEKAKRAASGDVATEFAQSAARLKSDACASGAPPLPKAPDAAKPSFSLSPLSTSPSQPPVSPLPAGSPSGSDSSYDRFVESLAPPWTPPQQPAARPQNPSSASSSDIARRSPLRSPARSVRIADQADGIDVLFEEIRQMEEQFGII